MSPKALESLARDLDLLLSALEAGETGAALSVTRALRESIAAEIAYREGPHYATAKQRGILASLTGRALYPPAYWEKLELTSREAYGYIGELYGFGEVEIRGTLYARTETSKSKKRKAA